jgi:hypothetical protein
MRRESSASILAAQGFGRGEPKIVGASDSLKIWEGRDLQIAATVVHKCESRDWTSRLSEPPVVGSDYRPVRSMILLADKVNLLLDGGERRLRAAT